MEQEYFSEDKVIKIGGDYYFKGTVVFAFQKLRSGEWRYVVENADGLLHIFSAKQLAMDV